MKNNQLRILTALSGGIVAMATVMSAIDTSTPADQTVAARPHLRQRTDRFFDRATRSGREAQAGQPARTIPNTPAKPAPCVVS